ncbi:hypothetical protein SAMN04487898_115138 [Pedobacter sp. ok626]|uniref:hypothetical protein n=1 Tax=Pedobacter sp. ok626 TaxID=1761882 RepID=UPI00087FD255|nr:hypothetical protein [Pedobacter sp. ok626]SDL15494.1 hypothetical protein SAMN04487898_115138 [Pedobacter sp. ok626]
MRTLYLLLFMLLFYLSALLEGCALFQKSTKTSSNHKQSLEKQLESSQLLFKTANKETQIFTYWNDSGFYQVQNIREQIDMANSNRLKAEEKEEAKQETIVKKTKPLKFWVYGLVCISVIACYWVYRRFF